MKDALIIGIGAKKPGGPPPRPSGMNDMPSARDESPESSDENSDDSGKKSPEEALVIRAGHDCDDCRNYHSDTGECDKVEGQFSPEDQCLRYFEAKAEGQSDDEGEEESGMDDEAGEYGQ